MTSNDQFIAQVLLELQLITRRQIDAARERQERTGERLGAALVALGHATPESLASAFLESMGLEASCADAPAAVDDSGPGRIVVVDDSAFARSVLEDGLTGRGYVVEAFEDPLEALAHVELTRPTVVVTDFQMPVLDGVELCKRLKEGRARTVPVLILTAHDGEAKKLEGLHSGADDYVLKTASLDELVARIESVRRRVRESGRLRRLFARYTSAEVVDEILDHGGVVLTGEKREVTILFADLRNFTSLAETLPAEEIVGLLNEALVRMSDAVIACGGTLDKFLGDGLMAVFGAPVWRDDDAARAVEAARRMQHAVHELNAERRRGKDPASRELDVGIGLNTGVVVAGTLGSERRSEYTCIGDAVNIASRFCSTARGGEILAGARTCDLAGRAGFEPLPPVTLKGKAQPVPVYRVDWSAGSTHLPMEQARPQRHEMGN